MIKYKCHSCIFYHSKSSKCVSGDSPYYEDVVHPESSCFAWSDKYEPVYILTNEYTIVKGGEK